MKAMVLMLVAYLVGSNALAQTVVEVSTEKTVSLCLPAAVSHIDLGSSEIDARLVGPSGKVVLVKGLKKDLRETNLTIVTVRDDVYTFSIRYNATPGLSNITIRPKAATPASYAAAILDNNRRMMGVQNAKDGLYAQLMGIYVQDSLLYFHLKVANATSLAYDLETIRFLLVNKKDGRRIAQQVITVNPITLQGNFRQVPVRGNTMLVAVLPKFTLSSNRQLHIELLEKGGERNLELKVPARKLAKAVLLPELQ